MKRDGMNGFSYIYDKSMSYDTEEFLISTINSFLKCPAVLPSTSSSEFYYHTASPCSKW